MRSKFLMVSLITVILILAFNVTPTTAQSFFEKKCPNCGGSGKITITQTCQTCGGSGKVEPTITLKSMEGWGGLAGADWAAYVKGVFENEEDVGVYGRATAEVKTLTATYTEISERTYFPSHEEVTITLVIEEIAFLEDWTYTIHLLADDINCPDCEGTGAVSVISDCPECGGSGYVTDTIAVGGVVAATILVAVSIFVVVTRRKEGKPGADI